MYAAMNRTGHSHSAIFKTLLALPVRMTLAAGAPQTRIPACTVRRSRMEEQTTSQISKTEASAIE
jgi:hypothetical protein